MTFTLLDSKVRKAKKDHRCIWCPEKIMAGDQYTHEKSVFDGDMQDHKWHAECLTASAAWFKQEGDGEFDAHSFKRGTIEEA